MENTRYDYSPIISRKPFRLPNNARVAVWVIINVEYFDIGSPEGGAHKIAPDLIHYSTRDYGPRIGIWRPTMVTTGMKAFLRACLDTTVRSRSPFDQAVRT